MAIDPKKQVMKLRQAQCLSNSMKSKAECWMAYHLATTGLRWIRQARWRGRIFDFWCREKGVAVEVDGPEHKLEIDLKKDELAYKLCAILVFRVRNLNDADAQRVIRSIMETNAWPERKKLLT